MLLMDRLTTDVIPEGNIFTAFVLLECFFFSLSELFSMHSVRSARVINGMTDRGFIR
jgi:hypothetical protein